MKKTTVMTAILALAVFNSGTLAEDMVIEEVVVTAQKREQRLQDVPVAVTALTAETIETSGIRETADLTRASASLTYGRGPTPNSAAFRVRGIGTNVISVGLESSVAAVIDGVAQAQPGQALTNLLDIDQVEVLRGPQSTLFGKNASAGLLNIITKSPTEEFEGYIGTTLTDDGEQRLSAVLSGPVTQAFGYRVAAYSRNYDGWAENLFTGDRINGSEEQGVRAKLAWQGTDALDVLFTGHHYKDDNNCCSLSHRELDSSTRLLGIAPVTETNPRTITRQGEGNADSEIDVEPESLAVDSGANLRITWSLGDFDLTSISSYNDWENDTRSDLDFSPDPLLLRLPSFLLRDIPVSERSSGLVSNSKTDSKFITQELRLSSPVGTRFDYMLGLYYASADTTQRAERNFTPAAYLAESDTESKAFFGQVTWRLLETTQLTLGARYNDEQISVNFSDLQTGERYLGQDSEDRWLGKLSLQHFLNNGTMIFASAANGYKGQGYDISQSFNQRTADNPVGAESSRSFEVGIKGMMFDRRLQLDLVGFYTEYEDYQAQNTEVIDDEVVLVVTNVGQLETKGIEIDANVLIGRDLRLTSSIARIEANIQDYPNADCYRNQTLLQGCLPLAPGPNRFAQDLSGKPLNNSPDWKVTLGVQYFRPHESLPFDSFVNINYQWQDEVNFDLKQNPGAIQNGYGILNLSAGILENSSGRYQMTLFVNNVFNQDYAAAIIDLSALYLGDTAYMQLLPRNARRYSGLRFRYSF